MLLSAYADMLHLHMVATGTESYSRVASYISRRFQESIPNVSPKFSKIHGQLVFPVKLQVFCGVQSLMHLWVGERKQDGNSHLLCEDDLKQMPSHWFFCYWHQYMSWKQHTTGKMIFLPVKIGAEVLLFSDKGYPTPRNLLEFWMNFDTCMFIINSNFYQLFSVLVKHKI